MNTYTYFKAMYRFYRPVRNPIMAAYLAAKVALMPVPF